MTQSTDPESEASKITQGKVESGYVVLPFSDNQFRDFIKSLLGSPQAITRVFPYPFEITRADIQSLNDLLIQRVTQQNRGFLAQFKSRIGFSDDTGDEQNSIDNLVSYNEIRSVETSSITIKWDFLIQFEDKETPERQSVTISFYAKPGNRYFDWDGPELGRSLFGWAASSPRGVIQFRIQHTARTWGADIEALLSGQLQAYKTNEPKLRRLADKYSDAIGVITVVWVIISCLVGLFVTTASITKDLESKANAIRSVSYDNLASIGKRIDFIIEVMSSGLWEKYFLGAAGFLLLSIIVAAVIGTWAETTASAESPSFIIFSRSDQGAKKRELRKLERKWLSFITSSASAIIYGVASSLIFERLFG
jgi:hypothetical protein